MMKHKHKILRKLSLMVYLSPLFDMKSCSVSVWCVNKIVYFSDYSYSCLDARFYDDETLTVVLRSVEDDENKMRVLAQLPLNSALRWEEEFIWDLTLRYNQWVDVRYVCGLLVSLVLNKNSKSFFVNPYISGWISRLKGSPFSFYPGVTRAESWRTLKLNLWLLMGSGKWPVW